MFVLSFGLVKPGQIPIPSYGHFAWQYPSGLSLIFGRPVFNSVLIVGFNFFGFLSILKGCFGRLGGTYLTAILHFSWLQMSKNRNGTFLASLLNFTDICIPHNSDFHKMLDSVHGKLFRPVLGSL